MHGAEQVAQPITPASCSSPAVDGATVFCQEPYGLKAILLRRPVQSARTIQAITLMHIHAAGEKQPNAFQVSTSGRQV